MYDLIRANAITYMHNVIDRPVQHVPFNNVLLNFP